MMTLRSSIASLGSRARRSCCPSAAYFASRAGFSFERERPHLGIGGRIGDQALEVGELGPGCAQRLDGIDQRTELGELARQSDIGVAFGAGRELGLDHLVAGEQRVEPGFREYQRHR